MRSRPLAAGRRRLPWASFLLSPILSSISLAFFTSRVAHIFRYCGPGLYLLLSAGTTELGGPVPSQKVSLIWSRSIPSPSARRKSAGVEHLAISREACWVRRDVEIPS